MTGMATHSSILAWRILWTEEPRGLQSMAHKESDTTEATRMDSIAANPFCLPRHITLEKLRQHNILKYFLKGKLSSLLRESELTGNSIAGC